MNLYEGVHPALGKDRKVHSRSQILNPDQVTPGVWVVLRNRKFGMRRLALVTSAPYDYAFSDHTSPAFKATRVAPYLSDGMLEGNHFLADKGVVAYEHGPWWNQWNYMTHPSLPLQALRWIGVSFDTIIQANMSIYRFSAFLGDIWYELQLIWKQALHWASAQKQRFLKW